MAKLQAYIMNEAMMHTELKKAMDRIYAAKNDKELVDAAGEAEDFINKWGHKSFMKALDKFFNGTTGTSTEELFTTFKRAIELRKSQLFKHKEFEAYLEFKQRNW